MSSPNAWQFFHEVAESCERLRKQVGEEGTEHVGPDLYTGVSMLAYHLRQAHNQAENLAGQRPTVEGEGGTAK